MAGMMPSSRRDFLRHVSLATLAGGLPAGLLAGVATPPGVPLTRAVPEDLGLSSQAVLDFVNAIEAAGHEMHSFMLLRHGKVAAEGWWGPYAPDLRHTMYSMSKSFTSTAVGLAVEEGKLTVEDKVVRFFPDDLPAVVSENLASLRVKDLLTMSVGNEKEPTGAVVKEENWVRTFLAQPITHRPGSVFMYNSAATYMCSAIVQRITGQTILDYLTPRLFTPLGISGMTWETCPMGVNTGGWGLSLPTEGLARFGEMLLRGGEFRRRRILSQAWVKEATSFHIQQPVSSKPGRPTEANDWQQGYGYQFWRCTHGCFRGDGAFGQFTVVFPKEDVVLVMTGETPNMQGELDEVWKHLLPAFKPAPLPRNPAAQKALEGKLESLRLPPPAGLKEAAMAASLNGRVFKVQNPAPGSWQEVAFESDPAGRVLFTARPANGAEGRVLHRLSAWQVGETNLPALKPRLISGGAPRGKDSSLLAASAVWKDAATLELTWRFIETPHSDTLTCKFTGNEVTISFLSSIAKMRGGKDARPVWKGVAVA